MAVAAAAAGGPRSSVRARRPSPRPAPVPHVLAGSPARPFRSPLTFRSPPTCGCLPAGTAAAAGAAAAAAARVRVLWARQRRRLLGAPRPCLARPFLRRFSPVFRHSFAVSPRFPATRHQDRDNGGKTEKNDGRMGEIWPKMLAGFSSSRVASLSPRAALAHRRCAQLRTAAAAGVAAAAAAAAVAARLRQRRRRRLLLLLLLLLGCANPRP